jgi:hypothetical protein
VVIAIVPIGHEHRRLETERAARSHTSVLQALFPALFGLLALAIACVSVRGGRATFRRMRFARRDRPAAFRLVIAIYLVMGVLSLAGALWICLLSARGQERPSAPQRSREAAPRR